MGSPSQELRIKRRQLKLAEVKLQHQHLLRQGKRNTDLCKALKRKARAIQEVIAWDRKRVDEQREDYWSFRLNSHYSCQRKKYPFAPTPVKQHYREWTSPLMRRLTHVLDRIIPIPGSVEHAQLVEAHRQAYREAQQHYLSAKQQHGSYSHPALQAFVLASQKLTRLQAQQYLYRYHEQAYAFENRDIKRAAPIKSGR